MGHITRLKINHDIGSLGQVTDIEGSIHSDELARVLAALRQQDYVQEGGRPAERETAQVPRSSVDMHGTIGEQVWMDRVKELDNLLRGANLGLDAARGAVRILSDSLGIESGDESNVAKLAKQVHGRLSQLSDQYWAMDAELDNLRGAMTRIQMPDVPERDKAMELPKQCQALAHHMDVLGRTGFAVVPEEARPGVHVHTPQTREERFEQLKKAQQDATRMMIELATLDGFVKRDTPPDQVMAKTMAWSIAEDQKRRDAEGVKQGAAERGEPKLVGRKALEDAVAQMRSAPGVKSAEINEQGAVEVKVALDSLTARDVVEVGPEDVGPLGDVLDLRPAEKKKDGDDESSPN